MDREDWERGRGRPPPHWEDDFGPFSFSKLIVDFCIEAQTGLNGDGHHLHSPHPIEHDTIHLHLLDSSYLTPPRCPDN